jgi:hypothetical protein
MHIAEKVDILVSTFWGTDQWRGVINRILT